MLKLKDLRTTMHPELYRRFKILCLQNRLSMNKQMAEFVRKFVEIHEKNTEIMKQLEKK